MSAPRTTAVPPRLEWRVATVTEVRDETPRTRTIVLDVPEWRGHRAGQHVDVRLVAEDGYEAQRSYSIASPPESERVELTVERIENAEVSPYLCDVLRPGDGLELRGPIGGYFVWSASESGPVLLVAGGSGIVPLMSMLRHRSRAGADAQLHTPVRLLYSARSVDDVIYMQEIDAAARVPNTQVAFTLTRTAPPDWTGYRRRVDRTMLDEFAWPSADGASAFVCGPTPLVESVASLLVDMGYAAERVRTERFGPTG
jgi:ferredoxin-NADP reductase